jgi:DNA-binding MarR family transcriptional regulator
VDNGHKNGGGGIVVKDFYEEKKHEARSSQNGKHIPPERLPDVYLLSRILHGHLNTEEQVTQAISNGISQKTKRIAMSLYKKRQSDGPEGFMKVYRACYIDYPELETWEDAVQTDAPPQEKPKERKYQLQPLAYFKNMPKRQWAVGNIIHDRGTALFVGDGSSGKTATVMNMMLCRAYGHPFIGREVKQGFIVWVAAEGREDIWSRVYAWMLYHHIPLDDAPNIWFFDGRVPFNNTAEVQDFIREMQEQTQEMNVTIDGFVFDTYARCTPGSDENNTQETKIIADAILTISEVFNTLVAVIHHMNAKGTIRGNTALRDAVDTVWNFTKDRDTIKMVNDKMRGTVESPDILLKLVSQIISDTDINETGPVVISAEDTSDAKSFTPRTELQMLDLLKVHGQLTCNSWQKHCEDVYNISKGTFHNHLKRITTDELVNRPSHPEKGKSFYYTLSEKGAMLLG